MLQCCSWTRSGFVDQFCLNKMSHLKINLITYIISMKFALWLNPIHLLNFVLQGLVSIQYPEDVSVFKLSPKTSLTTGVHFKSKQIYDLAPVECIMVGYFWPRTNRCVKRSMREFNLGMLSMPAWMWGFFTKKWFRKKYFTRTRAVYIMLMVSFVLSFHLQSLQRIVTETISEISKLGTIFVK